jgi:iron-sulfur cluster repair protein YtfE (RIC family)
MSSSNLPDSSAARHGTGEIDLTAMMAGHDAFRRDLANLARTAKKSNLADPTQQLAVFAGWEVFKRQLLQHHKSEDAFLWPPMREKLKDSSAGLSTLDAMEAEHNMIDPLLAGVDSAFADPEVTEDRLADVVDELVSKLTFHLGHEERDTLPLIGQVLTVEEWAQVTNNIRATGSVQDAVEMVPWILAELPPERVALVIATFPPIVGQMYEKEWKPKYESVPKWTA